MYPTAAEAHSCHNGMGEFRPIIFIIWPNCVLYKDAHMIEYDKDPDGKCTGSLEGCIGNVNKFYFSLGYYRISPIVIILVHINNIST